MFLDTLKSQTVGEIATCPSENLQEGGWRFMNVQSGRIMERRENDCVKLPMPEEVIERVHKLAADQDDGRKE